MSAFLSCRWNVDFKVASDLIGSYFPVLPSLKSLPYLIEDSEGVFGVLVLIWYTPLFGILVFSAMMVLPSCFLIKKNYRLVVYNFSKETIFFDLQVIPLLL